AAVSALEQELELLPPGQASRAHAVVLAALAAAQMRCANMERAAEVARRAVTAARAAGAGDALAEAEITLGSTTAYLDRPEAGLDSLRSGVRRALDAGPAGTALRGYVNLSDVLELLGRHAEAAETARSGLELAVQAGMARTLGSRLMGNQAEPLLRLGQWAEVDRLASAALNALPEGVFGA